MSSSYILPIFIVIISNVIYHNSSKLIPNNLNPFFVLCVAYITALIFSLICLFITKPGNISVELTKINIPDIMLGLAIVGVEGGYIMLYRNGWDISKGSLIANIVTAIILILSGVFLYKEHLNFWNISGVVFCFAGVFLLSIK